MRETGSRSSSPLGESELRPDVDEQLIGEGDAEKELVLVAGKPDLVQAA